MLKNKLFAGAIFALALFVAGSVSAAYTFPNQIDTLQEKKDVQTVLNMVVTPSPALTVDGVLGAKSIAAVKAFQTMKGLTVDGKIGPMTRAALEAAQAGATTTTTVAGCPAGALFNTVTGASCATTTTTVAGCTAGAAFSSTTGASCTGTTTGTTTVTGGAGDMTAVEISTDVDQKIVEGQADVKSLGFKVEASDSDVKVTSMKVTLTHGATGSTYLDRYVSDVAVWMDGTKVATIPAADFSKDTSGVYSKSVALANAVVKEGVSNKATFYVTTSGISNIDTLDMDATWTILADNFRFIDGTGVIMTPNTALSNVLDVTDITAAGDVKMVISKGSSNPTIGNVEVSATSSTSDVLMLEFKAKNTGADMTTDAIKVTVNTNATNLNAILGELVLKEGSTELASVSTFGTETATTEVLTFDLDNTYTLPKDTTKTFRVYAKINDVDNFVAGKYLTVSYKDTTVFEVASTRSAITETGSANGEAQTFYNTGAIVKYVSEAYTAPTTDATPINGTISLTFTVTAFGDTDVVLNKDGTTDTTATVEGATVVDTVLTASGLTADTAGDFIVSAGDTKTFTISKKISAVSGFVTLKLTNVFGTTVSNVETAAK